MSKKMIEKIEEKKDDLDNLEIEENQKSLDNPEKEKDQIKEQKIEEHKYPITSFIEDNMLVRKKVGGGFAFQTYYKFTLKGNSYDKKTMNDWEELFKKFLKMPVSDKK